MTHVAIAAVGARVAVAWIEKWDGKLPSVTGGAVPLIQIEDLKK